ncbi:histidyl-tRNA ligase [Mycoplasma wenyonii str. Massachusetts]|uniref:Histidine--tRNA ligase n=1 Tax=Mycoplasma wenyonii (strain Massachusetts) TaxID=1197325 RepID=I6YL39_MYCWM|nr:histidine--tRNA ligase [Mycoplasma wenyonii]AFN64964.1 histidyl-tRNA ligase [Mycoplasma wenyonii str. Massachusetts]
MIKEPRGTRTLFSEELNKREGLVKELSSWASSLGFSKIQTPTFENSSLYIDQSAPENEILKKELFFLRDESLALKPEETASVARAVTSGKLLFSNPTPLKFFYSSQCFRHERPQKQRFREFTQFGLEIIKASSWVYEVELIYMLDSLFREKFQLDSLKLRVNYLSNKETRSKWTKALTAYFSENNEGLSSNSLKRIKTNPIRILDDERDSSLEIVQKAPKIEQFLSEEEREKSSKIKTLLSELGLNYHWDESLVRGLDYYTGTVFEWNYKGLGIAGGGRYDELFNKFGLKDIPCVGLAIGIERLLNTLEESGFNWPKKLDKRVYFCNLLSEVEPRILRLAKKLRDSGIELESNWELQELKSHFRFSERLNIKWLLIYGAKEQSENKVILKEQNQKSQSSFELENPEELVKELNKLMT